MAYDMLYNYLSYTPMRSFRRPSIYPLLLMVVFSACERTEDRSPTYQAGGVVTLSDGAPLPGGWIECHLEDDPRSPAAKARIQPDGRFELGTYAEADGALEGTHRVMVLPPMPSSTNPAWDPGEPGGLLNAPQDVPKIEQRYQRFETSGLKIFVTSEPLKNRFQIRLERHK